MRTATPATKNLPTFNYIQGRLDAIDADTLAVGSPFDYKRSTLVYCPTDMPEPSQPGYQQALDRADAATTTVGEKMTDAAQTIRQNAPASGTLGNVADTAATTLDRAGTYLQQQDLADMRSDLEGIIRRHPIESLLVGLGVGYLLARSTRR